MEICEDGGDIEARASIDAPRTNCESATQIDRRGEGGGLRLQGDGKGRRQRGCGAVPVPAADPRGRGSKVETSAWFNGWWARQRSAEVALSCAGTANERKWTMRQGGGIWRLQVRAVAAGGWVVVVVVVW